VVVAVQRRRRPSRVDVEGGGSYAVSSGATVVVVRKEDVCLFVVKVVTKHFPMSQF
jgi:hypothetical protein